MHFDCVDWVRQKMTREVRFCKWHTCHLPRTRNRGVGGPSVSWSVKTDAIHFNRSGRQQSSNTAAQNRTAVTGYSVAVVFNPSDNTHPLHHKHALHHSVWPRHISDNISSMLRTIQLRGCTPCTRKSELLYGSTHGCALSSVSVSSQ